MLALLASVALAGGYLLVRCAMFDSDSKAVSQASAQVSHHVTRIDVANGNMSGNGPLPADNALLKDTFVRLQERARTGDKQAASRLARDLGRCWRIADDLRRNDNASARLLDKDPASMSPSQLRTYRVLLDSAELRQRDNQSVASSCSGVSEQMLATLRSAIARAGRMGDADARACHLAGGPGRDTHALRSQRQQLASYAADAKAMIQAGLAAGDWRVVDLIQQAYMPGSESVLAEVVGSNAMQHYRYLRLYRLGAEQHRVAELDRRLLQAASELSPAQIAHADAWAQESLKNEFQTPSTSATPPGWDPCEAF